MNTLKVKYLVDGLNQIQLPNEGDIGIDLYAAENTIIAANSAALVGTGVAIQTSLGYWLQVVDRSSVSKIFHVMAGIIDSANYTGEIKVRLFNHTNVPQEIKFNQKIAQAIVHKNWITQQFAIETVEQLDKTDRGDRGFGSTGS